MKVLIFEDEIPAYEKLAVFVETHLPKAQIVGWGRSINEAKRLLSKNENIDLIFSDIELLDGNSFSIYETIKVQCPIIFSTAFDQYVLKAFQTNGIAYLLKPYDDAKFVEAVKKYETLFATNTNTNINPSTIEELKMIVENRNHKKRFTVKKKEGIKLISTSNIALFQASGDFSFAYDVSKAKHVINYSLGDIQQKVDPGKFYRINRSEMINIDHIEKIEPYFKNRLAIKLVGFEETVHTSSAKTPEFRMWLER